GFGVVVGALIATYVARRVPSVNFRLLVASAYRGFLLWHGGLSASAPLLIATEGHFLEDLLGVVPAPETIFSSCNLFIVIVLIVTLPLVNWILSRTQRTDSVPDPKTWDVVEEIPVPEEEVSTPATRIENIMLISLLIGLMGLVYIVYPFIQHGFDLNLNIVIFICLFLGILLHKTPQRYLHSVTDS